MTAGLYAGAFVLAMFLWPLCIIDPAYFQARLLLHPLVLSNTLLASLTWYYNSSKGLSFFEGLENISESFMSGCANITLLYLPFILVFAYFKAVYYTLHGLFKSRAYTQEQWRRTVGSFRKYRLRQ